jgi:hypothetical protein
MIRAADDVDVIYRELRRNRVIEAGVSAGLTPGTKVPEAILLGAGYTPEEIAAMGVASTWPILDADLR